MNTLNLSYLSDELLLSISSYLNVPSLLVLSSTNQTLYKLCQDDSLWKSLFYTTFPDKPFKPDTISWRQFYISLYKHDLPVYFNGDIIGYAPLADNHALSCIELFDMCDLNVTLVNSHLTPILSYNVIDGQPDCIVNLNKDSAAKIIISDIHNSILIYHKQLLSVGNLILPMCKIHENFIKISLFSSDSDIPIYGYTSLKFETFRLVDFRTSTVYIEGFHYDGLSFSYLCDVINYIKQKLHISLDSTPLHSKKYLGKLLKQLLIRLGHFYHI